MIDQTGIDGSVLPQTQWPVLSYQWTLFLTRSRLLFYFLFRIRSIYFRNIYRLQMALGCRYFLTSRISMPCSEAIHLIIR